MADSLSLDLVAKNLVTDQIVLTINYDIENLTNDDINYDGEIVIDYYGRKVPKHAHGTINLEHFTSSSKILMENATKLFDKIINKNLLVKKINLTASNVISQTDAQKQTKFQQFDLFTNYNNFEETKEQEQALEQEENKLQHVLLDIKNKYGKNAILKGMNLSEGSTAIDRNKQIGGHHE